MSIEVTLKCVIVVVFVLTTICITYVCGRKHFASNLSPATQSLIEFMEGNPQYIKPKLGLDEQAYLLPFNVKYEFPRHKIELGEQLGCGEFGVVFKGTATGILSNEEKTTVAIKMIKPGGGCDEVISKSEPSAFGFGFFFKLNFYYR